jgi:hypothetical protein
MFSKVEGSGEQGTPKSMAPGNTQPSAWCPGRKHRSPLSSLSMASLGGWAETRLWQGLAPAAALLSLRGANSPHAMFLCPLVT